MSKTSERTHTVSARSARLWSRLQQWYGSRLAEVYGQEPGRDWCELVDASDNETVKLVLSQIREKHTTFPPTFPEFDALFAKARAPSQRTGPTLVDKLCEFVLSHRTLTPHQMRAPWTFLSQEFDAIAGDGKMQTNHGVTITGVLIPPDGDAPGLRVMVEDMNAGDYREQRCA